MFLAAILEDLQLAENQVFWLQGRHSGLIISHLRFLHFYSHILTISDV